MPADAVDVQPPSALVADEPLGARIRRFLPRGGSLPHAEWERRHKALLAVLWANVLVLPAVGAVGGGYDSLHSLEHAAGLLGFAVAASFKRLSPMLRSVLVSLGLLTSAALLVHMTDGLIEAHFYFFVVIIALTLYESWLPFLLAVAFVLVHHGLIGTIEPEQVYNRPEAWQNPWGWAAIHAFFVALAGAAGVIAWRLNEDVRHKMRLAQAKLATLSQTDSLTELANRRRAMADLAALFEQGSPQTVLVLLDLDGFKTYNDTFGHPAGDALLARLGRRLSEAVGDRARAYRLGGDEFCLIGPGAAPERATLEAIASAALSEHGQAFSVTASFGSAAIPREASTPADAMRLADQRMYARKQASRTSAMSQSKDVLLRAMAERHPDLSPHVDQVRELAEPLAREFGIPGPDVQALCHAAELHDVGKVAIPDAILAKPGALDDEEWSFVRRHTLIGQRIVAAAPALVGVGELIRSSHERWDGSGYPDGLAGDEIPLGARIVAVCDAYDAMTTDRPYRRALPHGEAIEELRRCAGVQFDPQVVEAFEAMVAKLDLVKPAVESPVAPNGARPARAKPLARAH